MFRVMLKYPWILFLYAGCLSAVELVIELNSEEEYTELTKRLGASVIPYRREPEGGVYYSDKYYSEVQSILSDVLRNDLPSDRSVHYYVPGAQSLFINELKIHNVPYRVKERFGEPWVVWENGYEDQVNNAKNQTEKYISGEMDNVYERLEELRSNKAFESDAETQSGASR